MVIWSRNRVGPGIRSLETATWHGDPTMNTQSKVVIAISFLVLIVIAYSVNFGSCYVTCYISNNSQDVVTDVTVHVAGNNFLIGKLSPGESRRACIKPRNQAGGVLVSIVLPDGTKKEKVVCHYLESKGFGGKAYVEIENGGVLRIVSSTIGPSSTP